MCFDEKFNIAPNWQKERFERIINQLSIELTEQEKSSLLWLSRWDYETENTFTNLFKKLQSK